MSTSSNRTTKSSAVLALRESGAEWLDLTDAARPRYGFAELRGDRPEDLGEAAERAFQDAGGEGFKPSFVLALGSGLIRQRLLQLPELGERDRRAVLLRKAERLWGAKKDEVVFSARVVDSAGQAADSSKGATATWLLSVASYRALESLATELSRRGFRAGSALALSSSTWNRTQNCSDRLATVTTTESDEESATIIVTVEAESTTVALVAGERFITRYELVGDFQNTPSLGTSLLQDLRNCAGYWRKVSRGGAVDQVELIGLDRVRAESLSSSIETILEGISVRAHLSYPDHAHGGRIEPLLSCLESGPFQAELKLPGRLSRKRLGALLATVGVSCLALVGAVHLDADSERIQLSALNEVLSERVSGQELSEDRTRGARQSAERVLGSIHQATEELNLGVPFELVTNHIAIAFEGLATIRSVSVTTNEQRRLELLVRGSFESSPLESMRPLRAIEEQLSRCQFLEGVELAPASQVPKAGGSRSEFTLRALLGDDVPIDGAGR